MHSKQATPPLPTERRHGAARLVLAGLLILAAAPAWAQLTPQALIGDAVSAPDSPRYSDIADAIKRYTNSDIFGARELLQSAKERDAKLPPVGVMLAKMHALSANSKAVRPALEQSINDEADDPEPYLLLAESTLQAGQTIEADALFDKAVKLVGDYSINPKRKRQLKIRAYRGRASVAERRRNWALAESDLRVWLEEDPENAGAHSRLGQVLCMLDRVDEGRQAFIRAKEYSDQLPNPYVMTARMYEARGLQDQAIADFKRAYNEDRSNETTLVFYAQSLVRSNQLKQAGAVLKEARNVAPESFNVWLLSGVVARMAGSDDAALRAYVQALSLSPGSRDVMDQLAQILVLSDDAAKKARAVQYARTSAKINPDSNDAKVTLAWTLYQTGRGREAQAALRAVGAAGGTQLGADAKVLLAKIFVQANRKDSARQLLTSALADNRGIFVLRNEAEKLLETL